jgi:transcriptional regulator with XRE-family HTH domain
VKKTNIAGNNIRKLRMREGLTQEELALQSGLSQGYINQLENGRRRYTQKCLELIVTALSASVVELFAEEKSRRVPVVREGFDIYKIKHPSKSGFIALINELPRHIVEHYFILMSMEKEIWRKKLSLRNSGK